METISMETISSMSYNRGSHLSSLSNSNGGSSKTSKDSGISITLLTSLLGSSNDGETVITKAMMADTVSSQTSESVSSVSSVGRNTMVDRKSCGESSVTEVAKAKAVTKMASTIETSVPVKGVGFGGSHSGANKSKNSKE